MSGGRAQDKDRLKLIFETRFLLWTGAVDGGLIGLQLSLHAAQPNGREKPISKPCSNCSGLEGAPRALRACVEARHSWRTGICDLWHGF